VIVSSLEGFPSLCEQRGEDDPTVSWQGCEDRSVALLVYLSRFTLRRLGQEAAQPVKLAVRLLELAVDHSQTFDEHAHMSACGLDRPGGDRDWRLSQSRQRLGSRETANASASQDPRDARLTDAHRFVGRRHELPQIKEPFRAQLLFEFEHGGNHGQNPAHRAAGCSKKSTSEAIRIRHRSAWQTNITPGAMKHARSRRCGALKGAS
jgi:hypothetical protein